MKGPLTDVAEAKKWLSLMEKYFEVMECPEERKVRLWIFLLQGSAGLVESSCVESGQNEMCYMGGVLESV